MGYAPTEKHCKLALPIPPHTLRTLAWRLRPKLKLIDHGYLLPASSAAAVRLMRSRLTVASSSDCPPERKNTPGTAGGTRLLNVRSVSSAVRAGLACVHVQYMTRGEMVPNAFVNIADAGESL